MTEMIERVIQMLRAIDLTVGTPNYYQVSRALIEAMREPPKGFEKIVFHGDYGDDVWRAMIDAILKGRPLS